jgi:hypothetical protein
MGKVGSSDSFIRLIGLKKRVNRYRIRRLPLSRRLTRHQMKSIWHLSGRLVQESDLGLSGTDFSPGEPPSTAPAEPGSQSSPDPDWLESLQPVLSGVPSPTPSQSTEPVESTGPLAGLRGVLAADAFLSRPRSPATRPTKLRISANQLVHVDMLRTW